MRSLLIAFCAYLALAATGPASVNRPLPGAGDATGGIETGCTLTPAACLGAGTPLPVSGSAGSTQPGLGCLTGRIVTPDAGGQSDSLPWCPDLTGDGIADLPAPPTHGEIVAEVCPTPPAAVLGVNPRDFGITGIHTWLWADGDTAARAASGTIRFHPVTCTLTPSRFDFDTADVHAHRFGHQRRYTATGPGHEGEDTEVQHLWEVTGVYPISLTITWARATTAGVDRVTTTTTRDYQVNEVRTATTTDT